jgi:type IV pilus assembly protein PilM
MFGFKPKSYLGIDLGAGGVKVVELQEQKKRPVLFTYGMTTDHHETERLLLSSKQRSITPVQKALMQKKEVEISSDGVASSSTAVEEDKLITTYAEMIKTVCKQIKTTGRKALVSLPVSSIFHTIVTLPVVKKDEFDHLLKVEIQKLLPFKLDETAVEYEVLQGSPDARLQRILVNAAPLRLIAFYSTMMQRAGFKSEDVEFEAESVALVRSLVGRDQSLSMIIDMGAERTSFFIVEEAKAITNHTIEVGGDKINKIIQNTLGLEDVVVEQMKLDIFNRLLAGQEIAGWSKEMFLDLFNPVVDPIMKEIEYSFDLFLRQTGNERKRPEKIILTGGAGFFPYLSSLIGEKFNVKCYIGDPWARVVYQDSLKPILHAIGPRMSIAVGLAMRNFSSATTSP